jgi:hypothetical protein
MKKALLLAVALMLVATVAQAQPPTGYIGLFTDDTRTEWCATGVGFYPVEVWVMCLPSYLGQICCEFKLCYPANMVPSTATFNTPIISVTLGDLDTGISVCYVDCQWNWHWVVHRTYYVTDPTQTYLYICAKPPPEGPGVYQFANCEPGFPVEPCIAFTHFYVNRDPVADDLCNPPTATEDASWGAIKSMHK